VIIPALLWIATAVHAGGHSSGVTAYYEGPISERHNRSFFESVAGKPVKQLVITSGGGDVDAGIALGLWVFERRIDVVIPQYCLSSCANYVFPAAQHKTIDAGAIVAWHGNYRHLKETGLWQDDIHARMKRHGVNAAQAREQVLEEVERLIRLEFDFFERIGVNDYLCWVGKMPPYNAPNYFFMSSQDMARFGVTRVQTTPAYADTDVTGFPEHILFISLQPDCC
jgi:hypothetical protein